MRGWSQKWLSVDDQTAKTGDQTPPAAETLAFEHTIRRVSAATVDG
jgi:hypothetical protein